MIINFNELKIFVRVRKFGLKCYLRGEDSPVYFGERR